MGAAFFLPLMAVHLSLSNPKSEYFKMVKGPPPGFSEAELNQYDTTYFSVYFQTKFIGNFLVKFNYDNAKFIHPDRVIKKLSRLREEDGPKVEKALGQLLPNHSDAVCLNFNSQKPVCKLIQPKIAAIVVNRSKYRVDLFVNPNFLGFSKDTEGPLPPSTAGFSLFNQNNFSASSFGQTQFYTLYTNNIVSYHNFGFHFLGGVSRTQSEEEGTTSVQLGQFNASYQHKGKYYSAGIMSTPGSNTLSTQSILGVSYQNYSDSFSNSAAQGTPLDIYLSAPAQVSVSNGSSVLFAGKLPAGKQFLNTKNFPLGSYEVTININEGGVERSEKRFFVKQIAFQGGEDDAYRFVAGALVNSNTEGGLVSLYPHLYPYYTLGGKYQRLLGRHYALSVTGLFDLHSMYASLGVKYFGPNYTVEPGLIASSKGVGGLSISSELNWNFLMFNLSGTQLFGSSSAFDKLNEISAEGKLQPLSLMRTQLHLGGGFSIGKNTFTVGGDYSRQEATGPLVGFMLSYSRTLLDSQYGSLGAAVNFLHNGAEGNKVTFNLNYFLSTQYFDGNFSLGYDSTRASAAGSAANQSPVDLNGSITKSFSWSEHSLGVSSSFSHSQGQKQLGLGLRYQSPTFNADFNWTHYPGSELKDNLVGSLSTNVVFSHGRIGVGSGESSQSGVLVDVEAPKDFLVKVLNDGRVVKTIPTNTPTPIFLPFHNQYDFTILPMSATIYGYNKQPKSVVLYRGNFQFLDWKLRLQYIFFGQVVKPDGKPLANALLLETEGNFITTGESGYLQAELYDDQKYLDFQTADGSKCRVTVPKIEVKDDLAMSKTPLVCQPIKKS